MADETSNITNATPDSDEALIAEVRNDALGLRAQLQATADPTTKKDIRDKLKNLLKRLPQGRAVPSELSQAIAFAQSQSSDTEEGGIALAGIAFAQAVFTQIMKPNEQIHFNSFVPDQHYTLSMVNDNGTFQEMKITGEALREHYATLLFHAGSPEQQQAVREQQQAARRQLGLPSQPEISEYIKELRKLQEALRILEGHHTQTLRNGPAGAQVLEQIMRNHTTFSEAHETCNSLMATPAEQLLIGVLRSRLQSVNAIITPNHSGQGITEGAHFLSGGVVRPTPIRYDGTPGEIGH